MTELQQSEWQEINDQYVSATVTWIRALLAERIPAPKPRLVKKRNRGFFSWLFGSEEEPVQQIETPVYSKLTSAEAKSQLDAIGHRFAELHSLPAISILAQKFELSIFEIQVLQLCLAFELDTKIGWICGLIQNEPRLPIPTFGLAMSLFDDPDWAATESGGRLREFCLLDIRCVSGQPFVASELHLPETILHYLKGLPALDPLVRGLLTTISTNADLTRPATQSNSQISTQIASLGNAIQALGASFVVVQLIGSQDDAQEFAVRLSRLFRRTLYSIRLEELPNSLDELKHFGSRWNRDSRLFDLALTIPISDNKDPAIVARLQGLLNIVRNSIALVCVLTQDRQELSFDDEFIVEIRQPDIVDQRTLWMNLLPMQLTNRVQMAGELSRQFSVRPELAQLLVVSVVNELGDDLTDFDQALRMKCNATFHPKLQGLAQRIDGKATWSDLILPHEPKGLLKQVVDQVRYRYRVYDEWGLANRMDRGLGVSAMFAGESGTGKTMAAEIIAGELGLDLYRVDLSSVVNKYIGETEKHLRRLFDAFESCGAVLFFDECDALFGKRSEVKDSHDRYANIEINYLLQRLESYRGVAIMATNNRGAIDKAFLRRLRFVVNFPMPELADRERIWKKHLGSEDLASMSHGLPVGKIDFGRLAQFSLSGGNIHSIVMNAAFRAAARSAEAEITMADLLGATRDEYLKLDRPISESQFRWVEPNLASKEGVLT